MVGFYCISSNLHVRGNLYSIIIEDFRRNFIIFPPTYLFSDRLLAHKKMEPLTPHLRQRVNLSCFCYACYFPLTSVHYIKSQHFHEVSFNITPKHLHFPLYQFVNIFAYIKENGSRSVAPICFQELILHQQATFALS